LVPRPKILEIFAARSRDIPPFEQSKLQTTFLVTVCALISSAFDLPFHDDSSCGLPEKQEQGIIYD
jgi:hypothetical protein